MPQMAPMSWIILYIIFITLFLLFMIKNYYFLTTNFKSLSYSPITHSKNIWKW
uniref:ATP synthase F0 subunit 8 n=1 Tax=Fibla maclachlani TaxID=887733 RepID=UPI0022FD6B4C|nr:ATP synthase F0 subunit 8 [Fibla maclachlani]WBK02891.1 ATP synthase F0 subunit 8 [Fibla maclachlani]